MKISVFIPTYNSSECISETLDSLERQTYRDIEILCVDDESHDETVSIIRKYALKDERIKLLQKRNEGSVPFSWNYVFPHLSGEFTIYMSHDDVLLPDTIARLVAKQASEPNIDCVIPSLVFFEKDINNPESQYIFNNSRNDFSDHETVDGIQAFDEMLDYSISGFALWRTSLIRQIGMPTVSFNSDECMQRIWARHCRRVAFSGAKFGYRQSSQSIVKGIKPYHYFSLMTNLGLFKEMMSIGSIPLARKLKMQYHYFLGLFYLEKCFHKNKELFSDEQKKRLQAVMDESYSLYSVGLSCPCSLRGGAMKVASFHKFFYNILLHF